MTTLHVTDQNTGQIVEVNLESPTGSLYIRDVEGNLIQLDLNSPSGIVKVTDADTGQTLTLDYSNPDIVVTVIDPNTGQFVDIDFSNASGNLYAIDENTGEFVLVNIASARFVNSIRGVALSISSSNSTYHLNFDGGVNDKVIIPAAAPLNNLPTEDFTVEFSVSDLVITENYHIVFSKMSEASGWAVNFANQGGLWIELTIYTDATELDYYDFWAPISGYGQHYELSWDAQSKTMSMFEDGEPLFVEDFGTNPVTSYSDDADGDLEISFDSYFEYPHGLIGSLYWLRVSDVIRHTSNFTSPSLTECPADDENTVLRLALDEGSGATANDTSGNNNNGTITGATWESDTTYHLNFDGVNNKIYIPASASIQNLATGNFTYEFSGIINSEDFPTRANIFNKLPDDFSSGIDWYVYDTLIYTDMYAGAGYRYHAFDISSLFNEEHHYALVWTAANKTCRLFVDGVEITVDDIYDEGPFNAANCTDVGVDLSIGQYAYDNESYPLYNLKGQMNWVRISNNARYTTNFTPPSLTQCPADDANTVLLLKLDEGTGTTVNDTSDNNNNGTITGVTWEAD